MRFTIVSLILGGASMVGAFSPSQHSQRLSGSTILFSSTEEVATEAATSTDEPLDPKEMVKLFGRLAEKYIIIDESGGTPTTNKGIQALILPERVILNSRR